MHIEINISENGSFSSVSTWHKGKELVWNTVTYIKVRFHDRDRLFKELNEYWATLPESAQDEIFEAYSNISEILTDVDDGTNHRTKASAEVARIYKHYSIDDVKRILCSLDVVYPTTMEDDFKELGDKAQCVETSQQDNLGDRTYRRSDYFKLLHLALRLRPMIPIFGHYAKVVSDYSGTQYKEYAAMELLSKTDVLDCPAMDKLIDYMEASLENFQQIASAIVKGLGTAETPRWLACRALFRRVAIGEIYYGDRISSIVTNVFNFVKSQLDSMPRNFGGSVRIKSRVSETRRSSDRDRQSVAGAHSVWQQLSDGDKVLINVYGRSPLSIATRVDDTISDSLVNDCSKISGMRASSVVHEHQIVLTQWTLSPAVSPRYIRVMGRESAESLLLCIGAAQALLFHWGFKELSALMSANALDDDTAAPMGSLWARGGYSKEIIVRLRERFPYLKAVYKRDQSVDDRNVGFIGIETLSSNIYSNDWALKGPAWLKKHVQLSPDDVVLIPPNLKDQLAELLLKVTEI